MAEGERKRRALWLLFAAAVAILDLWTKALWVYPDAAKLGDDRTRITVIEDWLYVVTTYNPGGVWSTDLPKWVLLAATIIAVPLLTYWMFSPRRTSRWELGAKAAVLGGAIGNLYDRIAFAKVRDWIDVCFGDVEGYHYPTFNVADIALVVGIAILLIASFLHGDGKRKKEAA